MSNYQAWVGKTVEWQDVISQAAVNRFCATFGIEKTREFAPYGFHWCLFSPDTTTEELGSDGHPPKGGFMPPIDLPRRMWAASRLEFFRSLPLEATVVKRSKIVAVNEKSGKTGALAFVEIEHEIYVDDEIAIKELQTIVYREAADSPMPLPIADAGEPCGWQFVEHLCPQPSLLFRYSSLTFNSHRIHYDLPYAQSEELYPALVVHGPLMATLALQLASKHGHLKHFSFKGLAPAFCDQPLYLAANIDGSQGEVSTIGGDGRTCLQAQVIFAA
ncbi:MAG: MaoC family dehydratase N-terminal domain-containing protein [Porticoccaceae bacterium]|nr:MaoC family dehydratase N-terminal domain-containing protein [Porticoccaceae bacterium]MDG1446432.1 MaoC family dehydratase N-terminal domain-containing protein [Porticoccaceae bacterium]